MAEGLECYRVQFTRGMDANEYACKVTPAEKSLGLLIRKAVWLGKGAAPAEVPGQHVEGVALPAAVAEPAPDVEASSLAAEAAAPAPSAIRHPPPTSARSSVALFIALTYIQQLYRIQLPAAYGLSRRSSVMSAKVTMNLSDEELALIERLRSTLNMSTNTGTVGQSLRIAGLIAEGIKSGKQLAFLDANGRPESKIVIPGLSKAL